MDFKIHFDQYDLLVITFLKIQDSYFLIFYKASLNSLSTTQFFPHSYTKRDQEKPLIWEKRV